MNLMTKICYGIISIFYIVDARAASGSEPVLKYYMDGFNIVMECVPQRGSECQWTTDSGNTYYMHTLPPNVQRNDSNSCTITFQSPLSYNSQTWTCKEDGQDKAVETYRIWKGSKPTAPIFINGGDILALEEESMNWTDSVQINCSTVQKGLPAPLYSINVTGIQNVTKVANNSVILRPNITETEAKLACSIEQHFLKHPGHNTLTLQFEDVPKYLRDVVRFDEEMNKQIFMFVFVSNPRLTAYQWSFSNSSKKDSLKTSVDAEKRYTSLEGFEQQVERSLSLAIEGFNETDKERYFFLELSNKKGSAFFGPLNSSDKIDDISISEIIGIAIGTVILLAVSILLAFFLYKRSFPPKPQFQMVTPDDGN